MGANINRESVLDPVRGEEFLPQLSRRVLERLMRYYRFLTESTAKESIPTVTSAQIAQALDVDATQIRKDFAAIGLQGMGRVGFEVPAVCRAIFASLGFDQPYEGILVGAGHLGAALLAYGGFAKYGLQVVAAFDNDPDRIGEQIGPCTVKPDEDMRAFVEQRQIRLAILTTPMDVSQGLADELVGAGVRAIWNFSPTQLVVPSGVLVRSEHISVGLSEIAHHLKREKSDR